jgi:hypothetical protein
MNNYVENLLDEVPEEMTGQAATPAANNLFTVNDKADKISDEDSEKYHRLDSKAPLFKQTSAPRSSNRCGILVQAS